MRRLRILAWATALALTAPVALAQQSALPAELSGRWVLQALNASQTFKLTDIKAIDAGAFTARLTWWTRDVRCAIQSEPIKGRLTPTGIAFESTTLCDVSFKVELKRAASGWEGKGLITSGPPAEVVLTAK